MAELPVQHLVLEMTPQEALDRSVEEVRAAITETIFALAVAPSEDRIRGSGIRTPMSDAFHMAALTTDEYPGRGVIMPVTAASIQLGAKDSLDWTYSRRTETSHNGSGHRAYERAAYIGGILTVESFSQPGYSSRSNTFEASSANEADIPALVNVLGGLVGALGRYRNQREAFLGIRKQRGFPTYDAQLAAMGRVWPGKVFDFNVLKPGTY